MSNEHNADDIRRDVIASNPLGHHRLAPDWVEEDNEPAEPPKETTNDHRRQCYPGHPLGARSC